MMVMMMGGVSGSTFQRQVYISGRGGPVLERKGQG